MSYGIYQMRLAQQGLWSIFLSERAGDELQAPSGRDSGGMCRGTLDFYNYTLRLQESPLY